MQLRKTTWVLAAVSALSMMMMACGGEGRTSLDCTADTDCLEKEICHPGAKVCVQTCTTSADCPDSAKTCDKLAGGGSSTVTSNVCQCASDQLCAKDERIADASALKCSTTYKACTGKTTTTPACTKDTDCNAGETCDTSSGTGTCKPSTTGQTCSGDGQSTCSYGQYCSSSKCAAPTAPTCENYNNFANKSDLGTSGPIIFNASFVSAATDTAFCTGSTTPKRVKVKVSAYSSTPFPATKDQLNGFFYVRVAGSAIDGAGTVSSSSGNYTVSGSKSERADIIMNFCVGADSSTLSIGTYFKSGNFYCYQASYP